SSIKFNGTNYLPWSKACMLSFRANKLVGYLTGTTPRPKKGNDEKWLCEDALVMSWLLNSIEPTFSPQYMMLDSAKDVWDAIAEQFSQGNNYAQAYELKLLTYQKDIKEERVYAFLGGLHPEYDPIRVHVLSKEPFPTLREAYNLVQHEETYRNAML
ncbi:UBN2_3 domain-containing protein, partial [Cephalotus follicularis]